jgi:hypothetical protein
MRPASVDSFELKPVSRALLTYGWLRAGLNGIAYRLGHLGGGMGIPRGVALVALSSVFYLA